MQRRTSTWRTYQRLLEAARSLYSLPEANERTVLARLAREARQGQREVLALLEQEGVAVSHLYKHLQYIAGWGPERRRLLSEGANTALLEQVVEQQGIQDEQLAGLKLVVEGERNTAPEQRRRLERHLGKASDLQVGPRLGWLNPATQPVRVNTFDGDRHIWLYDTKEVRHPEGLHPMVARSLIARYVRQPGVVVDPMAGSGVVAEQAVALGHRAWASDLHAVPAYMATLDVHSQNLTSALGEDVMADLLVLHPPLMGTLGKNKGEYLAWLNQILERTLGVVKDGGYAALVVPSDGAHTHLDLAYRTFQAGWSTAWDPHEELPYETYFTHHLTVARDASEAWHFLVARSPGKRLKA